MAPPTVPFVSVSIHTKNTRHYMLDSLAVLLLGATIYCWWSITETVWKTIFCALFSLGYIFCLVSSVVHSWRYTPLYKLYILWYYDGSFQIHQEGKGVLFQSDSNAEKALLAADRIIEKMMEYGSFQYNKNRAKNAKMFRGTLTLHSLPNLTDPFMCSNWQKAD
jgi:hypothetical protein